MIKKMDVTSKTGTPIRVLVTPKGEPLPHKKNEIREKVTIVAFYDSSQNHTPDGQFIAEYYFESFIRGYNPNKINDLSLQGDVPEWTLLGETYNLIVLWIINELKIECALRNGQSVETALRKEKVMNTKIEYMYRDASNYKEYETVIIAGAINSTQLTLIHDSLDEEKFIPSQVGLKDLQSRMTDFPSEDDHVWHEFEMGDITYYLTEEAPTDNHNFKDISEFAEQFRNIEWDVSEAMYNLGLF